MLDQLIESNGHRKENARRGGFLLSTLVIVFSILMSGVLWSLFAKDLSLGAGEFEISMLVAPVPVEEDAPRPVEPKIVKQEQAANVTSRQTNTLRLDESPKAIDKISVVPNTQKARPHGSFIISNRDGENMENPSATAFDRNGAPGSSTGIAYDNQPSTVETKKAPAPPPPLAVKKENTKPPTDRKVSLGVVNGQAINLVKPPYPQVARTIRASGAVNVQITIDERGNVVAANAVSGHPLLRPAAEAAARSSKFRPTLLSNEPVKATGMIIYNFSTQ